jgi:esterase
MKLHYKQLESSEHQIPIVILHGLFGSLDNWLTIGNALTKHHPVYLVDQRNHGNSPHDSVFDYPSMSRDLIELIDQLDLSKIHLIGHSMGGKTAMFFASEAAERLASLTVLDIAPRYYPPHHQDVFKAQQAVKPETLGSRKQAQERISKVISEIPVQQFLLKNLQRVGQDQFSWRHNLDTIQENILKIGAQLPAGVKFTGSTMFVKGSKSDYITNRDFTDIKHHFPNSEVVEIENAGHWLHTDQPSKLLDVLIAHISTVIQMSDE